MIESQIRNVINRYGYIRIDDMMREALSTHTQSYYRSTKNIGKDFITAPEISQLFGEMIALWMINIWQKKIGSEFALVELGSGNGSLMSDLLRTTSSIAKECYESAAIYSLELNQNFINEQKNIKWIRNINQIPKIPTIIIANEFFDALPIRQYKKIREKWFELVLIVNPSDQNIKYDHIDIDDNFQEYLLSDHKSAKDGAVFEESLESIKIISNLSNHISQYGGGMIVIDYGYNIPIRNSSQYNSTLQAIKDHKYCSILSSLGDTDISAHVDFNAISNAAKRSGMNVNITTQREFLIKQGIILRANQLIKKNDLREIIENQVKRLISNEEMGDLFKVCQIEDQ